MKGYYTFPRSPELEPLHLMELSYPRVLIPLQGIQSAYSKPC